MHVCSKGELSILSSPDIFLSLNPLHILPSFIDAMPCVCVAQLQLQTLLHGMLR